MNSETLELLKTKALSEFTSAEMSSARDIAISILRADYYRDVRDSAESIKSAIDGKEVADSDELRDRIHEECDSDGRVMYTHLAIETLLFSDNDSAYVDNFGSEGIVTDDSINWSALAYSAFQQDVIEELESEGIDVNNFDPDDDTCDCGETLDRDCHGNPRCPNCDDPCPCCSDGPGPMG